MVPGIRRRRERLLSQVLGGAPGQPVGGDLGHLGHAVGETTAVVQALIGAAPAFEREGFLVPLRHTELFAWCLASGISVAVPQTLMSQRFYQEPVGAFLTSVL